MRLLVTNISSSSPAINKLRRLITTSDKCHNLPRSVGTVLMTLLAVAASRFLPTPPAFDAPVIGGSPSEYRHDVWCGKTRMAWLPDGEKISRIGLLFYTEFTNVTDRRTPHDGTCRAYAGRHRAAKNRTKHTVLYCKLWTQAIASKSTSTFSHTFYTTNRLPDPL